MNSKSFYLFLLLSILFLSACEENQLLVVDSRLQPYFESFQLEAAERGLSLDFSDIEGKIEALDGVGGSCVHNTELPDVVLIDLTYWEQANEIDKEFIVFHELGHCILNRSHLDTRNDDNTCKSIMHSGSSTCTNSYGIETRDEYLDELFY